MAGPVGPQGQPGPVGLSGSPGNSGANGRKGDQVTRLSNIHIKRAKKKPS